MSAFTYRDGLLTAESVPLSEIAESVGTPVYCYSTRAILDEYGAFAEAFADMPATICYAMKANDSLAVVATLARAGAGADVVSGGELRTALAAGVPPGRIVFSGVAKTREEMALALSSGIMQVNVESEAELRALDEVARGTGRRAAIALRVNPDVEAGTLDQISTGRKQDKFGIAIADAPRLYRLAASLDGIEVAGVAVHIGSQLTRLEPYHQTFDRMASLVAKLADDGIRIRRCDLGGGLGIAYRDETPPSVADYAAIVRDTIAPLGVDIVLEPGRRLVGRAGVLLTRVVVVKEAGGRRFVIVDAAMNDLIRPALYGAWHPVRPVAEPRPDSATVIADIVGPVCESTDRLAVERPLPSLREGDLLAIEAAGAYSAVMASEYNGRPRVPEVMVRGGDWSVVRRRPSYQEMIRAHSLPEWLDEG